MQPSQETVVKTLRSLLNTAKNGLLEKQLRRDFREMEGHEIPYKSFGYNTLLDFLRASNEFDLITTNDGMLVYARVSQNSQHIVELVGMQNRQKRKKTTTKSMPFAPRFTSYANQNYSKPKTVYGRQMTQQYQPQRRQQNVTPFANTTNRNNYTNNNSNNYTRNTSQSASSTTNTNQNSNRNWSVDMNQLRQLQQVQQLAHHYNQFQQQLQVRNVISSTIAAFSNTHLSASAAAPSLAKPNVSVNTRLNPNIQSNEQSSRDVPIERESTMPMVKSVNTTEKYSHEKNVQQEEMEPVWDERPSNVIDLTKSPQQNVHIRSMVQESIHHQANGRFGNGTSEKSTTNDDKWKHDLCDPNQSVRKATKNAAINNNDNAIEKVNEAVNNVPSQDKKISPSWLTYNTNEPVKNSVFEHLGSKVLNDGQPKDASKNIQSRLKITKPTTVQAQADTVDFVMQKQQQQPTQIFQKDVAAAIEQKAPSKSINDNSERNAEKHSPKRLLEIYCQQKQYDRPEYECQRSRFKKFIGMVCVQGVKYTTEPLEYEDELSAENAAASKALENFKEFPITPDSPDGIAQKIYDCIGDFGAFFKYLPNIFEQKYEQSLPDGWFNIIQNLPEKFSIAEQATNLTIIYKIISNTQSKSLAFEMNSQPTKSLPHMIIQNDTHAPENNNNHDGIAQENDLDAANGLAPMKLPWDEPFWRIRVTNVTSTGDVWGRIEEDSEDWEHLDEALLQIENEISNDLTASQLQPCDDHEINDGGIFLVVHDSPIVSAFRVRIEEIDRKQKSALLFYIDEGFSEWLVYEHRLLHLSGVLLKFPAQAIHFRLFNVEDFEENPFACKLAKSQLKDKNLRAKLKLTQTQFEKQLESIDSDDRISVILYDDTSTDSVRNVNKEILQEICAQMQPPRLNPRDTNIVYVTHVNDKGDVYCRLHGSKDMQLIEQSLHRIADRITDEYRIDSNHLMMINDGQNDQKLYLVYEKSGQQFYRATISTSKSDRLHSMAICHCIDYGFEKCIPCEHIYDLARLSLALSSHPPAVVLVQLNGIEPNEYTEKIIQRLRKYLCCQKPIGLDVVTQSKYPLVDLRKTIEYTVNALVRRELERLPSETQPQIHLSEDTFSSADGKYDQNDSHLSLHPMPKIGEMYDASVITALSPSLFYIRLETNDPKYNKMINCLWKDCESSEVIMSKKDIILDQLYAGRLRDGYWYRVKIQAFPTNETVSVEKWDCGEIEHLSLDALRPLSKTYRKLYQMVFCARLHGLYPCKNSWDKDDCARFQELTVGKMFKVDIRNIRCDADNNYVAEVVLITPNNINISEVLIRESRANYL